MKLASISIFATVTVPATNGQLASSGAKGGRLRALSSEALAADLLATEASESMSMASIEDVEYIESTGAGSSKSSKSSKAAFFISALAIGPSPNAPFCSEAGDPCSSGYLLKGVGTSERYVLSDTLDDCPDGKLGEYLVDESIEEITVAPVNGKELRSGEQAEIKVKVHAWQHPLYYHDIAHYYYNEFDSSNWTYIATSKNATKPGLQTLDAVRFTLPTYGIMAIRVAFGFKLPVGACFQDGFGYDDFDDVVINVAEGEVPGGTVEPHSQGAIVALEQNTPEFSPNDCAALSESRCGRVASICQWTGEACAPN